MQNNPKAKSKARLEKVAERSLLIGNGFYDVWRRTKDASAGRLAISSYNTVNKATQTIIDLDQLPVKGHNKRVVTARKRVGKPAKGQKKATMRAKSKSRR